MLLLYVIGPVALTRLVLRGRWTEIAQAYGIWTALLALAGWMHDGTHGEGYGWAILMAMFTTVLAIPILVLLLKAIRHLRSRSHTL